MPEVIRTVQRSYRDDYESDDDRSVASPSRSGGSRVHRYRVTPSRVEEVVEDDRRSSRLDVLPRGERIEVDRRSFVEIDRPRSAVESRPRSAYVERVVEREPFREPERETRRTVVYERERREPESARPWERAQRPWEERDVRETDLTIVKRGERRDDGWERERETDVRVEKRVERRDDSEYDREIVRRETEYYDHPEPPPAPLIIRPPPAPRQEIIFQEAAPRPPIVVAPREEEYQIIRQEIRREEPAPPPAEPRRQQDEEYYYNRREVREIGPGRGREEEMALAEYDRRDIRPRESISDGEYSDEDVIIRKKVIRRERSLSGSPHHKRHLAEGALAGAGVAALLANHKEKQGNAPEHRGRKVLGGAALGAIGAEVITRARSRYRESHDRDSRSRSRSSSRHSHRKVKTALGLAVAGLAAAAAAKYVSNRNANRDEDGRGRSRTRSVSRRRGGGGRAYYSDDEDDYYEERRSASKHTDPKHRKAAIAKAGAATAAVAGVAEYFRNKSRQRSGERSKSRIRTGAEIAGAGLAGAAVAGLYENRKAKDEVEQLDEESRRRSRRRSRSSRSRARSVYSDPGVDPELGELGLVQYGSSTVPVQQPAYPRGYDYDPAAAAAAAASGAAAGAAYGATRGSGSRSRRQHRDSSFSADDQRPRSRSRSHSRARDIAGVAAGTAAAAIGINQYKKRKEKKEAERERERRRYEEEAAESPPENYYARRNNYQDDYSPSPPRASGGYYHEYTQQTYVPPQGAQPGFAAHGNQSTLHVNQPPIPPYNPQDYAGQGPPAAEHNPYAGYPPPPRPAGENVSANTNLPRQPPAAASSGSTPYFPPPPTTPLADEQLHQENRDSFNRNVEEDTLSPGSLTPPSTDSISPPNSPSRKSVKFGPLSPTSSRSLAKIHKTAAASGSSTHLHDHEDSDDDSIPVRKYQSHDPSDDTYDSPGRSHRRRRRRNSDPSSDRPNPPSKHRRRYNNHYGSLSSASEDEVEVLPDRFDEDGRPLDRYGNSFSRSRSRSKGGGGGGGGDKQTEMVERLASDFGDVMQGRKTWKDLLAGLLSDHAGVLTGSDGGRGSRDSGSPSRRERRRRDRDR